MQPSFFVWASLSLGWFSNRMGKSVDDGTCKSKNWLDQLQGNKLGSGSHVQTFPCAFSWSTDIPILLLNQPNILFQAAAKLTWLEVLRAVFTGTVNKTKWRSPRVLCFGSLFRNYPPYCKSIYLAIFIKNCPFFDVLLGKWQSRLHGQDHTQSALRATVHRNSECQGLDPRVKGPLLPRPPTGNR